MTRLRTTPMIWTGSSTPTEPAIGAGFRPAPCLILFENDFLQQRLTHLATHDGTIARSF